MEQTADFAAFLKNTVNLNATRIDDLETSVTAIQNYIKSSVWAPTILGFEEQGSWAHDTIIKPVDKGEFDADLLVRVEPVDGWSAKDYIRELRRIFKQSGLYKKKVKSFDYCVTITYANDKRIDVAPLVVGRLWEGSIEVCNAKTDDFERSEPTAYTKWLIAQNATSGGNSFRKVTRLLKYLRDIKTRFVCPSVLLTTMLANLIEEADRGSDEFKNVPCTLRTLIGRLDDWLQSQDAKPTVCNPFLPDEDFADQWSEAQFKSFCNSIERYRGWVDEAFKAPDEASSVAGWRKLFGDDFAPAFVAKAASTVEGRMAWANPVEKAFNDLIDTIKIFGLGGLPKNYSRMPHQDLPVWAEADDDEVEVEITATVGGGPNHMSSYPVASGELLQPGPSIYFKAQRPDGNPLSADYRVEWRITNAPGSPKKRGEFNPSKEHSHERSEALEYRGVHMAEAFVIRKVDNRLVGWSDPFFVAIE
jgi:hypothetical protein